MIFNDYQSCNLKINADYKYVETHFKESSVIPLSFALFIFIFNFRARSLTFDQA